MSSVAAISAAAQRMRGWTGYLLLSASALVAFVALAMAAESWWSAARVGDRLDEVAGRLTSARPTDAAPADAEPGGSRRNEGRRGSASGGLAEDDAGRLAAERIAERYVFAPRPPERFRSVQGVLGDVVMLRDGSTVRIGESVDGAQVREIGGNWVRFHHRGEEIVVDVAGSSGGGRVSPGPGMFPSPPGGDFRGRQGGSRPERGNRPSRASRDSGDGERRSVRLPANVPPEVIERIRERSGDNVEIIVGDAP